MKTYYILSSIAMGAFLFFLTWGFFVFMLLQYMITILLGYIIRVAINWESIENGFGGGHKIRMASIVLFAAIQFGIFVFVEMTSKFMTNIDFRAYINGLIGGGGRYMSGYIVVFSVLSCLTFLLDD